MQNLYLKPNAEKNIPYPVDTPVYKAKNWYYKTFPNLPDPYTPTPPPPKYNQNEKTLGTSRPPPPSHLGF